MIINKSCYCTIPIYRIRHKYENKHRVLWPRLLDPILLVYYLFQEFFEPWKKSRSQNDLLQWGTDATDAVSGISPSGNPTFPANVSRLTSSVKSIKSFGYLGFFFFILNQPMLKVYYFQSSSSVYQSVWDFPRNKSTKVFALKWSLGVWIHCANTKV